MNRNCNGFTRVTAGPGDTTGGAARPGPGPGAGADAAGGADDTTSTTATPAASIMVRTDQPRTPTAQPSPNTDIRLHNRGRNPDSPSVITAAVANSAITPVGNNGYIDVYVFVDNGGAVQVLVDVAGYFTTNAAKAGNTSYTSMTPTRLMDTRNGTGVPTGRLVGGTTTTLQIGGVSGILAGVKAVAINFTAVGATTNSYLITYADGTTRPAVSGLQFPPANATAGLALVPVGSNGKVAIYVHAGQTHLVADVVGYFTAGTAGLKYHPTNYTRMIDTRLDGGPVPADATKRIAQGNTVIAADPSLILNITVTAPTGNGFVTAYPDGTPRPNTSNLNYYADQTIPNLAIAATGSGTINVYNFESTGQSTHLVIDCLGYFAAT